MLWEMKFSWENFHGFLENCESLFSPVNLSTFTVGEVSFTINSGADLELSQRRG